MIKKHKPFSKKLISALCRSQLFDFWGEDVYKRQRVESGETKVFNIRMKVSPETKELPEGSSYKLNLTLKSNNWNIGSGDNKREPAFGVTTSVLLKPTYTLSEPTFVVSGVTFSPEVTAGVTTTTASITIDNISDSKARNVSVMPVSYTHLDVYKRQ